MSHQLSMFDVPETLPYQPHSATSKAAAESARGECSGKQRNRVLLAIRKSLAGLTDEEGIARTAISPNAYRPRRGELVEMGFVRDSGKTRGTTSGRQATVWEAV